MTTTPHVPELARLAHRYPVMAALSESARQRVLESARWAHVPAEESLSATTLCLDARP